MSSDIKELAERPLSLGQTIKAVAWSFIGLRKGSGYQQDIQKLNPVHVIIAGILAGVLFVVGMLLLVRWIVASGIAA